MSRKMKSAFDKADWTQSKPLPDWMTQEDEPGKALESTVPFMPEEARAYLISRARYLSGFNKTRHEYRIGQLSIADEVLADENPLSALALMHESYPFDRLDDDEDLKEPSDDARTRASLLYAHFLKRKELRQRDARATWLSYYDDLLAILKVWAVPRDEKRALAQELILDHPQCSRTEIARMSEDRDELKFGQSCLSQWIAAGMIVDPYSEMRPTFGPGTSQHCVPRSRSASPRVGRGKAR